MGKLAGVERSVLGVGACLVVAITGCAAGDDVGLEQDTEVEQGATGERIGEAAEALTYYKDGFKVVWSYVGHPWAARKIAACGPSKLFALNYDYHLYFNDESGSDSAWVHSGYPSSAREIGCDGPFLFAMNYDKNLYMNYTPSGILWDPWKWVGKPFQAEHINSGGGNLYALNTNKSIYTSGHETANSQGTDSSWIWRNTASEADRVTGANNYYGGLTNRAFALNLNKSLWYNDKLLVSSSGANWHSFPNAGLSFAEISAGSATVLYGLTTTYDLWKAEITEDNCSDGIDNDADGVKDANDSACLAKIAAPYCATHPNGNYCFSRFSDNFRNLAKCSGGQVAGIDHGDYCVESSTPGQDYVGVIQ